LFAEVVEQTNKVGANCQGGYYSTCIEAPPRIGRGGGRQHCRYGCCSNGLNRSFSCGKCCSYAGEAVAVQTEHNTHNWYHRAWYICTFLVVNCMNK